jgi:beta-glucosidase
MPSTFCKMNARPLRAFAVALVGALLLLGGTAFAQTNLALNRPATSSANPQYPASEAVDGNLSTRWASAQGIDPQWIYVDLGAATSIGKVILRWETAYAKAYQIQTSNDAATWTSIYSTTTGAGGTETLAVSGSGRYVRMYGTVRGTAWGYSLWEFEIYAASAATPTATARPSATATSRATATATPTVAGTNLALGKPATASSIENAGTTANLAVDGNTATRWSSAASDPQWLSVDLGATASINRVRLVWETAYGQAYQIQVSNDNVNWTTIKSQSAGTGGTEDWTGLSGSGRYVRMYGTTRGTAYGYSLWEFEVYGTGGAATPTVTPTPAGGITVPLEIPYVEYLEISLAPADANGTSLVVAQNTAKTVNLAYPAGTSLTVSTRTLVDSLGRTVQYSAKDSAGVAHQSNPLTITVYPGLDLNVVLVGGATPTSTATPTPAAPNLALGKPATASSVENAGTTANLAFDGNAATRWSSLATDPQWIYVDLGATQAIKRVVLRWETAYASAYQIQTSADAVSWTTIYSTTSGNGGVNDVNALSGSGRYVRMYGTARGTIYGYSLWEMEVYNVAAPTPAPTPSPSPTPAASFTLTTPANGAMIANTHRPAFSWPAVSGSVRYEVWMNVSRADYDFTAPGNLLDRFTKVADTTTATTYAPAADLPDRWTYKWYVKAFNSAGTGSYSNIATFSLYFPTIKVVNDGVPIVNGCRDLNKDGTIEPYEDWHQPLETRVGDLLSRMTLDEKAFQMFYNAQVYPTAGWYMGPAQPMDIYNAQLAAAKTRLGIPIVELGDTIHGYATSYPVQSALAATRDWALIYQLGDMQRREEIAVGARGLLGPLAELGTKVIYPRIQEGNGEKADFAAAEVRALIAGLQGGPELAPGSILPTVKHWPGEGAGGEAGIVYDAVTINYHMIPWRAAFEANAGSVMPGYAGSAYLDPSGLGAGNSPKIINYLRGTMGYDGMVCTDWLPPSVWIDAANAGSDVMGGSDPGNSTFSMATFESSVPQARIDEAVRRILRVKFRLGLFDNPYGDPVNGPAQLHTAANAALARQAAREAMTVLKNDGVLPLTLASGTTVVVTGARAADGPSCCIWTSYFHPEYGALTILQALQARGKAGGFNVYQDTAPTTPNVAIVAVGEASYTHGTDWPNTQPYLPADQVALIQNFKNAGVKVVVLLVLPRPYVISDWNNLADAVIAVYRSGDEGAPAMADVVFGDYVAHGKLPWQLPASLDQILLPGGTDSPASAVESWDLPYDLGATAAERQDIRSKINAGAVPATSYGTPLYPYGAGQ